MVFLSIKNRNSLRLAVVVEPHADQKGLAFVMHGLGGTKDGPMQVALSEELRHAHYTVVRFDTTNTFGESEGRFEDATVTSSYADLEDVIAWAKTQAWHRQPFLLAGHSLGASCTAYYAENHPDEVLAVAPIAAVVSGKLSLEAPMQAGKWQEWQRTGWQERGSATKSGLAKRLPWSHMEDRLKYDLLPLANRLTMPVFLLAGELDDRTPPAHQQILLEAVPGPKELHIIAGAPHTFGSAKHLRGMKKCLRTWLRTLP